MSRNFNILGNSGCNVELFSKKDGTFFVRKTTNDAFYMSRLKKQAEKQMIFFEQKARKTPATPKIFSLNETDNEFYFDMDYCGSVDCITYLEKAGTSGIQLLLDFLISIISDNIKNSEFLELDREVFYEKHQSVKRSTLASPHVNEALIDYDKVEKVFRSISTEKIPIGFCHGDLTLSNVLAKATENRFELIDFLDSFIETPLNDIVKLRQDTRYMWSTYFYRSSFDKGRISLILSHLDEKIDQFFKDFEFYNKHYVPFQVLNLLRILPYCEDVYIIRMLTNNINRLIS